MSNVQGFNFIQRPQGKAPVRKNPPFQASQANFNSLFGITGQGVGIRKNNKFMNADYYNKVILPKNPDWQRTVYRDWDNDGRNDIVIHDPQGNIKYFNGYSLYKVPKNHYSYIDYASKNANGSLKEFRKYENPTKVKIGEAVAFIYKAVNDKLKAFGRADLIKAKNDAKFNDRLKSIIKRFMLLPYAYTVLGYDAEEIMNPQTSSLKLYAKKGIKDLLKQNGAGVVIQVIDYLINNIKAEIDKDVKSFVEGVVNGNSILIQPFFETAINAALADNEGNAHQADNDNEIEEELEG